MVGFSRGEAELLIQVKSRDLDHPVMEIQDQCEGLIESGHQSDDEQEGFDQKYGVGVVVELELVIREVIP